MARPSERDLVQLGPWPRGANNVAREDSVPATSFRKGVNVDVLPGGKVRRRQGRTKVADGADSLWSNGSYALCRKGSKLMRFAPASGLTELFDGLSPVSRMTYCSVNDRIYVSDGRRALCVTPADGVVRPWGVPTPAGQPSLTATTNGGLDAGDYQVAITYVSDLGEESGSPMAASISVLQGGGIGFSSIPAPVDASVSKIRIYRTHTDDEEFFLAGEMPTNATSGTLYKSTLGARLETLLMSPLPAGQLAAFAAGRVWVAAGSVLYRSQPQRYGLCALRSDYYTYAADIDLVAPATDADSGAAVPGVFVAAGDRTFFLRGSDPDSFVNTVAYTSGAVPGTLAQVAGGQLGIDGMPDVPLPLWVAKNGTICVGMPDGSVMGLTTGRFAAAPSAFGRAVTRYTEGAVQTLISMEPSGMQATLASTDSVTVQRVKNGVVV